MRNEIKYKGVFMKPSCLSALVLSGALTLSLLTACGGKEAPSASDTPEVSGTPAVTEGVNSLPGASKTTANSEASAATSAF